MKRFLTLFLSLVYVLLLASCNLSNAPEPSQTDAAPTLESESTTAPTHAPTQATTLAEPEDKTAEMLEYKLLDDDTYAVVGPGENTGNKITVESCYEGKEVTAILSGAFMDYKALESITLPDTLVLIENEAFRGCENLAEISIPKSVSNIGDSAFSDCTALGSVSFESGSALTYIGKSAFDNCVSLGQITIPSSVEAVSENTFYGCTSLVSAVIPNGVTNIKDYAFYNCTALNFVTIPAKIEVIEKGAFMNCASLTEITVPNSLNQIEDQAFSGCVMLSKFSIGLNTSLTRIGRNAFEGCEHLRLGSSSGITYLPSNDNPYYAAIGGTCDEIADVHSGTVVIADYAFYESKITEARLPSSLRYIGNNAFGKCKSLIEITLPNNLTHIENGAFYYCNSIEEIHIPKSVVKIGANSFSCCDSLEWIKYGGTVSDWSKIEIGPGWKPSTRPIFVYCSNGAIER